jgi:ribose transport system ATP-binding protein
MTEPLATPEPLLRFEGVGKQFNGVVVVDDVTLDVPPGRILALLGANGAGKSTLIKMLAGVYPRDGGRILFRGRDVDAPGGRSRIAFIHQELGLIEWMTVAENMAFSGGFARRGPFIDWKAARRRAAEALEIVGGGIDPEQRIFDLPRTEKSLLAIARALALEAEVIVLDEPTASLPSDAVERLFDVLRGLRARGVGMIYVTHRLDEVTRLADDVAVMRNGRLVFDSAVADTTERDIVHAIVGRAPLGVTAPAPVPADRRVVVRFDGIRIADVGPVSLEVREGDVVGLAGLRGAGHELVGRSLLGLVHPDAGRIELDGREHTPQNPVDAVASGVGFVTSNREEEGLARGLAVRENLFLNPGARGRGTFQLRSTGEERREARDVVARYGVRPTDPERPIETLSGGNQQKVILARWLDLDRHVLVLEEPTMGVDVGAKADIYALIGEATAHGTAVLVISTDFEEVAKVCSHAFVFNRGRVVAELGGLTQTVANIVAAASGTQPELVAIGAAAAAAGEARA